MACSARPGWASRSRPLSGGEAEGPARSGKLRLVPVAGSVAGAVFGGLLLGAIPGIVLIPGLALIPLISAFKTARHAAPAKTTA
ncbi:hypothetical protein ACNPQM_24135 [Streptomyces sp. NPDC056231]|uniref:hypothetical protein n=1 Tax=Streptomyces sp. NPDC056231 TaxID=3345755 RepID=UPI003AAEFA1F